VFLPWKKTATTEIEEPLGVVSLLSSKSLYRFTEGNETAQDGSSSPKTTPHMVEAFSEEEDEKTEAGDSASARIGKRGSTAYLLDGGETG